MLIMALVLTAAQAVCTNGASLFACADPTVPLCWDVRRQVVIRCSSLPKDVDGPIRRSMRVLGAHGLDVMSTAIAIDYGASETNPLGPTVEHRVGLKLLAISVQVALQEWLARDHPKAATWISRGTLVLYACIAAWNLRQADLAGR